MHANAQTRKQQLLDETLRVVYRVGPRRRHSLRKITGRVRAVLGVFPMLLQRAQEIFPKQQKVLLQFLRAIAIAARPRLNPACVTAILASVCIFNLQQFKVLFPVRTFFLEWRSAKADFHPGADVVVSEAGLCHILKVFVAGHGASTKRARFNRRQKGSFLSPSQFRFDQIAHSSIHNLTQELEPSGVSLAKKGSARSH